MRVPSADQLGSVLFAPRSCSGVMFTIPVPLGFTTMMLAPWAVARTNAIFVPLGAKAGLTSLREPALSVMLTGAPGHCPRAYILR